MQDLLTRGIDEQGNIRTEETGMSLRDSVVGRIPKEWEVDSVRIRKLYFVRLHKSNANKLSKVSMITAANIFKGKIQYDTCRFTSQKIMIAY